MKTVLIATAVCLSITAVRGAERIDDRGPERMWADAKINGKPARLVFDTGVSVGLLLLRPAAERLNLALHAGENRGPDEVQYWLTNGAVTFSESSFSIAAPEWLVVTRIGR